MLKDFFNSIKEGNIDSVASISDTLSNLIDEDLNTDKEDLIKYNLESTVDIAEKILEFDEKYHNQQGQVLKVLTPEQMLSRLPTTLAQLQARNNSQEPKNEIRQLLYSLYRSKMLFKTIYKHLISII